MQGRSLEGYEAFCAAAYPQLVAAFAHQFGDRWLAEELAQEAIIRAGARWGRVSQLEAPVGWAFRVGCNLGVSHLRRRAVERRAIERRPSDEQVHVDIDPWENDDVRAILQYLTDRQRQAIIARYYLGLSAEEAAQALGTTAGAVRVQTHRALQRMRTCLDVTTLDRTIDAR